MSAGLTLLISEYAYLEDELCGKTMWNVSKVISDKDGEETLSLRSLLLRILGVLNVGWFSQIGSLADWLTGSQAFT